MLKCINVKADKGRNLRYTNYTMGVLKKEHNINLWNMEGLDVLSNLPALVWGALIWEDKELTLDQAGEILDYLIDNYGMEGLMGKIQETLEISLGVKLSTDDEKK